MGGDAHQLAKTPRRQLGVAVQGEEVPDAACNTGYIAQIEKRIARALGPLFGQRRYQQLQLAALALPANPALLGWAELAVAVQQDEARCPTFGVGITRCFDSIILRRVLCIQRVDAGHGAIEQLAIMRHLSRWRIAPVGQKRKLRLAFWVGQIVQLQSVHQLLGRAWAGQHARNHHHHPMLIRNAAGKCQARQMLRPRRLADQPIDHRHHGLGDGEHHQQCAKKRQP